MGSHATGTHVNPSRSLVRTDGDQDEVHAVQILRNIIVTSALLTPVFVHDI